MHAQPLRRELTAAQEQAVVADRKLLPVAVCVLSLWTYEQITAACAPPSPNRCSGRGQDFALQHVADRALPAEREQPYTLMLGMRSWLFAPLRDPRRPPAADAGLRPAKIAPFPPHARTP